MAFFGKKNAGFCREIIFSTNRIATGIVTSTQRSEVKWIARPERGRPKNEYYYFTITTSFFFPDIQIQLDDFVLPEKYT
jgi:hypothetical protein